MWRYIEKIRNKPKTVRNRYAFFGAVVFSLLVVGIWSLSLPAQVAQIINGTEVAQDKPENSYSRWRSALADLRQNLSAQVSGGLVNLDEVTPEPVTDPTGIDLTALRETVREEGISVDEPATTTTSTGTSSLNWQRQYTPTEGKTILIATSSSSGVSE